VQVPGGIQTFDPPLPSRSLRAGLGRLQAVVFTAERLPIADIERSTAILQLDDVVGEQAVACVRASAASRPLALASRAPDHPLSPFAMLR
ncbi:MAG TPA: hypothetical protein VEA35_00445, partial [Ramlibacter sp.]|nr:hypothetical protein [Ramlibacter sp.]